MNIPLVSVESFNQDVSFEPRPRQTAFHGCVSIPTPKAFCGRVVDKNGDSWTRFIDIDDKVAFLFNQDQPAFPSRGVLWSVSRRFVERFVEAFVERFVDAFVDAFPVNQDQPRPRQKEFRGCFVERFM